MSVDDYDELPDVRDGLTRKERVILKCIDEIQQERGGRNVPTAMLYGRVVEHVNISVDELQLILQRLTAYNQNPQHESCSRTKRWETGHARPASV